MEMVGFKLFSQNFWEKYFLTKFFKCVKLTLTLFLNPNQFNIGCDYHCDTLKWGRLLDGHLARVPHGAVESRRPSGRRTPFYCIPSFIEMILTQKHHSLFKRL